MRTYLLIADKATDDGFIEIFKSHPVIADIDVVTRDSSAYVTAFSKLELAGLGEATDSTGCIQRSELNDLRVRFE